MKKGIKTLLSILVVVAAFMVTNVHAEDYTITFDANGGTPGTSFTSTITLAANESYKLTFPTEEVITAPAGKGFKGYLIVLANGEEHTASGGSEYTLVGNETYNNATVKYLWADFLEEINLSFFEPTINTSTTVPTDEEWGGYEWDKQTNTPKFYSLESDSYVVTGTYWGDPTSFDGEYCEEPFIGTFKRGKSYTAEIYIYLSTMDYALPDGEYITVNVNNKQVSAIVITDPAYDFIYVSYSILVDGSAAAPFKDVKTSGWYFDSVIAAYELGIIKGYDNGNFGINDKITRGQLALILYRIEGEPDVSSLINKFADVDESKYYANAVKWAKENGIVNGYANGNFGPNDNITRKDFAVMLHNFASYLDLDVSWTSSLKDFADYNKIKGNYAEPAMEWAYATGIINGAEKNGKRYLNPNNNATRAEAAAMLVNFVSGYFFQ